MDNNKPLQILLVEDDEDHAHFIKKSLDKKKFSITTLTDGGQAFDYLKNSTRKPDIVLLDYHLPLMDGLEVIKKTKENGGDYAFIFLTADTSIDVAVEAMKAGALDFMPKTGRFYTGLPSMIEKVYRIHKDKLEKEVIEEEQKKLEAQLQRAKKMESLGTLAGGVAHDLNNILAGLVTYPELMDMEIDEMLEKVKKDSPLRRPLLGLKKSIGTIQKSGKKSADIVQDLLTLSRRGVSVIEVTNLNEIISEYLKSLEYEKLKQYHPEVQVETNLETNLSNILGSPIHLSKTVMNLVSNAAEFMPDGGTIFISTENRYIDRPVRGYGNVEEGDYVTLRVADTGVGISPEDKERIFEPFYTKKVMGRSGTGIGMAVVWGTVKDHKGYIDLESSEGKGTTFTLYFSSTREEVVKGESPVSIEDYMGNGESVLVVDDVEEQLEIASRILKKLGYSVTSVSSGEKAVDYMRNNSADLLVLDMMMEPGIDGLETYKRIVEFHPGQKAIIASGFSETERVKEAQRLGAGAYVQKPFLLEKIGLAMKAKLEK
jgi:signal transduction histidine kinase